MAYDLSLRIASILVDAMRSILGASWDVWANSMPPADAAKRRIPPDVNCLRDSSAGTAKSAEASVDCYSKLDDVSAPLRANPVRPPMYNLAKAKEEIDTVAKHTTDLAAHVLSMSDGIEHKLESFKKEILSAIDARFRDLERAIVGGEQQDAHSSAISDLGSKVSQLLHSTSTSTGSDVGSHTEAVHGDERHSDEYGSSNNYGHSDDYGHSGDHNDHHHN